MLSKKIVLERFLSLIEESISRIQEALYELKHDGVILAYIIGGLFGQINSYTNVKRSSVLF